MPSIEGYNKRLTRVQMRVRGKKIYLRATLPKKDGNGTKQQDIATKLDIGSPEALRIAFSKAQRLESDLNLERFDWADWGGTASVTRSKSIGDAITLFENDYWNRKQKTKNREETYKIDYSRPFSFLPEESELTGSMLLRCLCEFDPASRDRLRAYTAYGSLARLAGIELPLHWKDYRGEYKPSKNRYIPKDAEVIQVRESIKNPEWRWVYSVLAAYGIRPHELFFLEWDLFPKLYIFKGKTHERIARPLLKDWALDWALEDIKMPPFEGVDEATHKQLGAKVTKGFIRQIKQCWTNPIVPYSLRDRYAIRCAEQGISESMAAKLMGHSVKIHCEHYQRWIDDIDMDKILD